MYGNLSLCPVYGADGASTAVPVPVSSSSMPSSVPAAAAVIIVVIMLVVMVLLLLLVVMAVMTAMPFFPARRDRYPMAETQGSVTPASSRGNRARPAHAGHAPPSPYYCLPIPSICRNLAFSAVSAGLLQPLFSQFSKS
jgi:hypothetical protein